MASSEYLSSDQRSLLAETNASTVQAQQRSAPWPASTIPGRSRPPPRLESDKKWGSSTAQYIVKHEESFTEKVKVRQLSPWSLDAAALLSATAYIVTLLIVILHYDNKPIPDWSGITINTLISILSGAIKAMLAFVLTNAISQLKWLWFWNGSKPQSITDYQLYDDASRGPLGSLLILISKRNLKLYSLGAVITIVMIAFSPFLQQIPTYPNRLVPMNDGNGHTGNRFFLNSAIKGSYYAGLFRSSGTDATLTPVCPGGNCTFTPYASLGVCSACQSVQSLLKAPGRLTPSYNFWTLPNNVTADPSPELMVVQSTNTLVFQNLVNNTILDMSSIYFQPGTGMTGGTPEGADECILYLCVQKYRANVSQGVFNEEIISVWPEQNISNSSAAKGIQMPLANLTNIAEAQDGDESSGDMTITTPDDPSSYKVDIFTLALLRKWLVSVGTAQVSTSATDDPTDTAQVFWDELNSNPCSTKDNSSCGVGTMMERIAVSLTNSIRTSGDEVANGSGQSVETFLKARWQWVTLPIAMIVLMLAFFILTVFVNTANRLPVWKSSSLPLMAYGLQREAGEVIASHGPELYGMKKAAKRFRIAMEKDGSDMGLVAK